LYLENQEGLTKPRAATPRKASKSGIREQRTESLKFSCLELESGTEDVHVNPRLKKLMKDLGEAINGSLAESEQIAQVIAKIKEEGFDIFLVLEATIGFNRRDERGAPASPELVSMRNKKIADPEFAINANDVRFLKSLRISVED
jgi:hypothetical protein